MLSPAKSALIVLCWLAHATHAFAQCASVPHAPTNLAIAPATPAVVTWQDPTPAACRATAFDVEIGYAPDRNDAATVRVSSARSEIYLGPGTFYVRVIASNSRGRSDPSSSLEFRSTALPLCDAAPAAPILATPDATGGQATLRWRSPDQDPCPALHYVVSIESHGALWSFLTAASTLTAPVVLSAGVSAAEITAVNRNGRSAPSNRQVFEVRALTPCSALPPAPTDFRVVKDATGLTFLWSPSPAVCGRVQYVLVVATAPGGPPIQTLPLPPSPESRASFPAHGVGTYYVHLVAATERGVSPRSNEVVVTLP